MEEDVDSKDECRPVARGIDPLTAPTFLLIRIFSSLRLHSAKACPSYHCRIYRLDTRNLLVMKYGKEFQQILNDSSFPDEWKSSAIEYGQVSNQSFQKLDRS
jgi:hypothetical protein